MGRTERPIARVAQSSGGNMSAPAGFAGNRSSSFIDENEPANFSGRPGQANQMNIMERIFPWYKLYSVTTLIFVINVVMFVITLIVAGQKYGGAFDKSNSQGGPSTMALKAMGGKWEPSIVKGHVYLLLTPIVLHAGLLHLLFNTLFLLRFGWVLETRWKPLIFTTIYILAGYGGVVVSTLGSPNSVSVGASGSLFGILGANLFYVLYNKEYIRQWMMEFFMLLIMILINFLIGIAGSGVDNWAHFGGLVTGILAGGALTPSFVPQENDRKWMIGFTTLLVVCLTIGTSLIWILHKE